RILPSGPPSENDCHGNVDRWVLQHPGDRAVRGWLVFDNFLMTRVCRFNAHSVVEAAGRQPVRSDAEQGFAALSFFAACGSGRRIYGDDRRHRPRLFRLRSGRKQSLPDLCGQRGITHPAGVVHLAHALTLGDLKAQVGRCPL
ncbi:MAG: hypothetical protein WBC87_12645, partial [Pseudolabrys sp.]